MQKSEVFYIMQIMKILILGANSYVGARIYFELQDIHEVVGTYHSNKISDKLIQLDITSKQGVLDLVNKVKPEVIIHCANNASKKWCDEHPKEAVILNQDSTSFVVEAANSVDAKLIYISSTAAINPKSLYGETKLASEDLVKKTKNDYLILEPGIVIGFSPKVKKEDGFFSSLMDNLEDNKVVEYENSTQYRPTYIGHLCEVIKEALDKKIWNKVIQVSIPVLKTKYEMAKDILESFGVSVREVDTPKIDTNSRPQELSELQKFNLPVCIYEEAISKIITEIKNRDNYNEKF